MNKKQTFNRTLHDPHALVDKQSNNLYDKYKYKENKSKQKLI